MESEFGVLSENIIISKVVHAEFSVYISKYGHVLRFFNKFSKMIFCVDASFIHF